MIHKFASQGVKFYTVYVAEAHSEIVAGHKWLPQNAKDRQQRAVECNKALVKAGCPQEAEVILDTYSNKVAALYGNYPNSVFIIGLDGKLAYKSPWMDYEKVDKRLDELLKSVAKK